MSCSNANSIAEPEARFWTGHLLVPVLVCALLLLILEAADLDRLLSAPFYDASRGGWFLREAWWTEGVIHRLGRKTILLIGVGSLLSALAGYVFGKLPNWRRALLYLALCIALGSGIVALGKAASTRHCPWDIEGFGGTVPYSGIFASAPGGYGAGHGFPGGHASGGFALFGLYFIGYEQRKKAWRGLAPALLIGSLFSFGQVARGAHFVSHNLVSALICWLVALLLYKYGFSGMLFVKNSDSTYTKPTSPQLTASSGYNRPLYQPKRGLNNP